MKRKWLLISLAVIVAVALVWLAIPPEQRAAVTSAIGLTSPTPPTAKRPICSSAQVPVGNCMPQWEADLPPDPGEAGKATIAGIITNSKGVRDDVYRYIWYEYPDSERTREALFLMAKAKQITVLYGDSLGKEETRKLAEEVLRASDCYMKIATPDVLAQSASEKVRVQVTNTPERWKRSREFEYLLAHNLYFLKDESAAEACGFDPAALPN